MGKTTLAAAAMHHPAILDKYSIQHFLSCESAMTSFELVALLGSHLGFESSGTLFQIIIQHFHQCGPCLLVLDNVETPWEPLQSREKVEDFLSALADVRSLALVITMRGAERPGKVKWSRPFLSPLEPLPISASRQIFFEVADEPVAGEETALDELLGLSGSLPLAVSLMANVVSSEGYSRTLSRWQQENIALLSDGYDKNSNLEKSIILSLSGARMASQNAQDLLSLLSLLPDGITMHDVNASKVPISQISHSASSLIRTSLAYMDTGGRLKSLVPIREYIRRVHPPSLALSRPLRTYLEHLLLLWTRHRQLASGNLVPTLRASLGNIHELILQGLSEDRPCWLDITNSIIRLNTFTKIMLKGPSPLMNKVADLAETAGIPPLNWRYRCEQLCSASASADLECWINDGVEYYSTVHCPIEEVQKFYTSASEYYHLRRNFQKAHQFIDTAMCLGKGTKKIDWILTAMRLRTRTAYSMRDACEMIRLVKEARSLAQFNAGPWYELEWLHMEASANWMLGNLRQSQNLIARCQEQVHLMGIEDSDKFLSILDVQADICLAKTEYFEAKRICELAIAKTSSTRSPQYHAHFHIQNAYIGILTGSHEREILSNLAAAEAVYTGRRRMLCVWVKGELDLSRKLNENASFAFKECLSKTLGFYADVPVLCLATLGDPRHKMERPWNILRWAMIYLALVRKMKDLVATFHALRRLADLFVVFNDEETALNLFNTALEGATNIDIHRLRAECMAGIGDIMSSRGNMGEAKQMWEASIPLFVRSSQSKDAAAVEARLVKFVAPDRLCHLAMVTHSQTNMEATTENLELVSLLSSAQNSSSVEVPAERGSGVP
ncbi:hypothetical protein K438DRAFT_1038668 [Mycena galopus ATCC 62051]|nr:hypothetical protein K438DRAFT_1038668 [Mycena galopus ATCC 62051]